MDFIIGLAVSIASGLYTSLWGAFKDCPFEKFKPKTFPRSILFSVVIFATLFFTLDSVRDLHLFQLFFFLMGLERVATETYKGFFRKEDLSKYFIPTRMSYFGKHIKSDITLYLVGLVLSILALAVLFVPLELKTFGSFFIVAAITGLLASSGGAYKDGPFEGFEPLKFFRSATVVILTFSLFYPFGPVRAGFLVYMCGGIERFFVEYYKTYIQRTMSGKFRKDLPRFKKYVDSREPFHYLAWLIIIGVAALYLFELMQLGVI